MSGTGTPLEIFSLWETKKIEEGGYIGKEGGRKKRQNKERPSVCTSSKNVAECLVCARLGTVLRPMRKCMSKRETLWAGGMEARLYTLSSEISDTRRATAQSRERCSRKGNSIFLCPEVLRGC